MSAPSAVENSLLTGLGSVSPALDVRVRITVSTRAAVV